MFVPDTDQDMMNTICLKQKFVTGSYSSKMSDVFGCAEGKKDEVSGSNSVTYAQAVKQGCNESFVNRPKRGMGYSNEDQEKLGKLQAIGGRGRSKDEEREYKRLMERRRQSKSVGGKSRTNRDYFG